ncbi:MAG: hypothetical protein ACRC33_26405 [Gemmataceae bacterium]
MRRILGTLLLIPALASLPAPAKAQYAPDPLVGYYINASNGGVSTVVPQVGGYLFTNENGDQAAFSYAGPRRLVVTNTLYWDARIVATVGRDRLGRLSIRFDTPSGSAGAWVYL